MAHHLPNLYRGVVKRFNSGLQNHQRGFDSFRPCQSSSERMGFSFCYKSRTREGLSLRKNSVGHCFLDRAAQAGTVAKGNGRQAKSMRSRRSTPSAPAKKFDKFRLVEFFYPLRKQWYIITRKRASHHRRCISSAAGCISFRNDDIQRQAVGDIQCFALMKYTAPAVI